MIGRKREKSEWQKHKEALLKRALMIEAQKEAARRDEEDHEARLARYMPRTGHDVSPLQHLIDNVKKGNPTLIEKLVGLFRKRPVDGPRRVPRVPGHPEYGTKWVED